MSSVTDFSREVFLCTHVAGLDTLRPHGQKSPRSVRPTTRQTVCQYGQPDPRHTSALVHTLTHSAASPARTRTHSCSEPNAEQTPKTDCPRHRHTAESTGTRDRVQRVHTPRPYERSPRNTAFLNNAAKMAAELPVNRMPKEMARSQHEKGR